MGSFPTRPFQESKPQNDEKTMTIKNNAPHHSYTPELKWKLMRNIQCEVKVAKKRIMINTVGI